MTEPPLTGRHFYERTMSEEITQAAPEAVKHEPSVSQNAQDQTTKTTEANAEEELADTWPDADPEKPEEAEAEDDDDSSEEERPKKLSKSARLRRQNERLKAENEALRSGSAATAVQNQTDIDAMVAQEVGPEPKEADYADWFAYERAMNAYEADKRQVARQVKSRVTQSQQAEQTRVSELLDDYVERCEEVSKTLADFKQVVSNPEFKTTDLVKRLILDAGEKAPLVAYNLAQNPKLCARINAMSPLEAAREIGRIEGRVSLPKNNATRAAPPLSAVKGGASPQRGLGKSMSDYERWRNS